MIANARQGALLANPIFRRVWMIGALSGVARFVEMLVVGIFAFAVTGSPFLVALLFILRLAPMAAFGALMGVLADRLPPRLLLLLSLVAATLVSGILSVLFVLGVAQYWHVVIAMLLSGLVMTTDMPVRRRILGDAAGLDRIAPAMSLDSATINLTRMLGPLLGGILSQWLGTGAAFALNTALYALCIWLIIGVPAAVSTSAISGKTTTFLFGLLEALRFVANDRDVLRILLVTIAINLWGFPFLSMIPVIGGEELHLSAGWLGVLTAMEGAGAFLGALFIAIRAPSANFRRLYYFSTLGYLIFIIVTGSMTAAYPVAVLLFCVGLAGAGFATMQSTLIYSVAPPEMRGRLFGLLVICIGASSLIGFSNVGFMGELFGGSNAIRIVAAEGLIPLLVVGIGWPELRRRRTAK